MAAHKTVPAVTISVLGVMLATFGVVGVKSYTPLPDTGYPAGYLSECPGVTKNASISPQMSQQLQVVVYQGTPSGSTRRSLPIEIAPQIIGKDKNIDFKKKKTVLFASGYLDNYIFPQNQALANSYLKKGYNVFVTDTIRFLMYIYPKSARLAVPIGKKFGDFLVQLTELGLEAENLELIGISLGAHIVGYAAKQFYAVTGKKPSRITGADPSGPCFRSLPPRDRLNSSDAEKVDIIHTNIDVLGIAETLGHIDFYVNGGEFQPGDIPYIPCLSLCSHVKSLIYFWQAIENPKMFMAIKCDNLQDARLANCYNNTQINYLGLETEFNKPGIYYLSTLNSFPYYRGKAGLKAENEIFTTILSKVNSDDILVVKK